MPFRRVWRALVLSLSLVVQNGYTLCMARLGSDLCICWSKTQQLHLPVVVDSMQAGFLFSPCNCILLLHPFCVPVFRPARMHERKLPALNNGTISDNSNAGVWRTRACLRYLFAIFELDWPVNQGEKLQWGLCKAQTLTDLSTVSTLQCDPSSCLPLQP